MGLPRLRPMTVVKTCRACAMTQIDPDISAAENISLWTRAEAAKRWVLVNFMKWGWCTVSELGPLPTFERLSENASLPDDFRNLFGDDREDYGAALNHYYNTGTTPAWQGTFITENASARPHEDWAEPCTHAMHLLDVLHSAIAVKLIDPVAPNHLNRSMGLDDIYPFVVPPAVREKLAFACRSLQAGPQFANNIPQTQGINAG